MRDSTQRFVWILNTGYWKYRRSGTELAVITYEFTNGTTTLVKNF